MDTRLRRNWRGARLASVVVILLAGTGTTPAPSAAAERVAREQHLVAEEQPSAVRITPVGTADPAAGRALALVEVRAPGGQSIGLDRLDLPPGWSLASDALLGGRYIRHDGDAAAPLEIPIAGGWVELRFLRTRDGGRALVECGRQARLIDLSSDAGSDRSSVTIELGRGSPWHLWRDPAGTPYRRPLGLDDAVSTTPSRPAPELFRVDGSFPLAPSPVLPAKSVREPLTVLYPRVFVPERAELRFGLRREPAAIATAQASGAAPKTPASAKSPVAAAQGDRVSIELSFTPAIGLPESHASREVELRPGELEAVQLDLATGAAGFGALRLALAPAPGAPPQAGELQIVDPVLDGYDTVAPVRNNVILLTLDTTRADHLSIYGYPRATTPFLDQTSSRLAVFDHAYCQVTNTRPSHFSIFTSRYCKDLGIWNNNQGNLSLAELSLTEVLKSAGWSTGAVLSVSFMNPGSGLGQGFDEYLVPRLSAAKQLGAQTTSAALDFVGRHAAEPFFLWVHYFDAHLPYQPVPEYRGAFWPGTPPGEEDVDRSLILKDAIQTLFVVPNRAYMTAMYDGALRYIDEQIRSIFTYLESAGLLEKTIVVIAADHGESLGEHGLYFIHNGLYEPTVHVPLIFFAPGGMPPGRSAAVVENIDIAPTILDLIGLAVPPSFEGRSLAGGDTGKDTAFFEQWGRFATGFREGTHKFIDARILKTHPELAGGELREWYNAPALVAYDLAEDPHEEHNLLEGDAALRERDLALLNDWLGEQSTGAVPASGAAPSATPIDPELERRLRELGYIH